MLWPCQLTRGPMLADQRHCTKKLCHQELLFSHHTLPSGSFDLLLCLCLLSIMPLMASLTTPLLCLMYLLTLPRLIFSFLFPGFSYSSPATLLHTSRQIPANSTHHFLLMCLPPGPPPQQQFQLPGVVHPKQFVVSLPRCSGEKLLAVPS